MSVRTSLQSLFRRKTALAVCTLAAGLISLQSCAVDPNAPATNGNVSFGALASNNMADYYYPKVAGYTYIYKFVETEGTTATWQGPCDTLRTLGYQRKAPNGDSLYAFVLTYRMLEQYAGRQDLDLPYIGKKKDMNGYWLEGDAAIANAPLDKTVFVTTPKPKPVGTDTILAGLAGRVKSVVDNFRATGNRIWQSDTIYFAAKRDSVVIWERDAITGNLIRERMIFYKDVNNNMSWQYGLWEGSTYFDVNAKDDNITTAAGSYRTIKVAVTTPDINAPITENKWFGYTAGLVRQVDKYKISTTGNYEGVERVMTRDLVQIIAP